MRLSKLLKDYSLNSDIQYFEMILESLENGQRKQAVSQFNQLPKQSRKDFLLWAMTAHETPKLNQSTFSTLLNQL